MRSPDEKRLFPLFVSLEDVEILVVGGGSIAERRVGALLPFGARITVVSPVCTPELIEWGEEKRIRLRRRKFEFRDLQGFRMVLAATSDHGLNEQIYRRCRELEIPANDCSDQELTDFHFPGIVVRDDLTVGVNASGRDHRKAKLARMAIEKCLMEGDF